jgi:hypothetical protein
MRAGDPGWEVSATGENGSWCIGRDPGQAWPKHGWGTDFSAFRCAIPEAAGFEGVHIYLDADMLVLGDIAELLDLPRSGPWLCLSNARTDVSVIDCSAFRDQEWWPALADMKPSGRHLPHYRQILIQHGMIDQSLPGCWNTCDDRWRPVQGAKLLHYTVVPTQPWHPYRTVRYMPHINQEWVAIWSQYEQESRAALQQA